MMIAGYETHPAADVFPLMQGEDFAGLVEDIQEHGLREPIVLVGELVLDGRNRLRACDEAEVEPTFTQYAGATDTKALVDYVKSHNLTRRHLSPSERAMAAARAIEVYEAAARARMEAGVPTLGSSDPRVGKATEDAARDFGTSGPSVARALRVLRADAPELVEAIDAHEVTVSDAAKVVSEPKATQRALLKKVRSGEARSLASAARDHADEDDEEDEEMENDAPDALREALDLLGEEVPAVREQLGETRKRLSALKRALTNMETPNRSVLSPSQRKKWPRLVALVREAAEMLDEYEVDHVCETCGGATCGACRGAGWVSKARAKRRAVQS